MSFTVVVVHEQLDLWAAMAAFAFSMTAFVLVVGIL